LNLGAAAVEDVVARHYRESLGGSPLCSFAETALSMKEEAEARRALPWLAAFCLEAGWSNWLPFC
jgi:hypothetical protein